MKTLYQIQPYFFILPAMLILFIFLIFPLFWNIYISIHDVTSITILKEWGYIGLDNFIHLLNDSDFHASLLITLKFVGGSVLLQFGIGLLIAVMLNQKIRNTGLLRSIIIIPWTVSAVIAGFSFKFIYDDNFGILNYILQQLGINPVGWLSDPNIAIWSIVFANMWYGTPFTILFLTAGVLSINPTLYEAAIVDGATKLKSFFYITLPLLKPFILINLILISMWSINFFDLQLVMTGGGPLFSTTTASLFMYKAFEEGLYSKGTVAGIILVAINLIVAYVYVKLLRRQ